MIKTSRYEEYSIRNKQLKKVGQSYLGGLFDYNMRWGKHINKLVNKTPKNLKTLRLMFFELFMNNVNYGMLAWGGAYDRSFLKIQKVQNKSLKMVNLMMTAIF